jgi:hypothetical protein
MRALQSTGESPVAWDLPSSEPRTRQHPSSLCLIYGAVSLPLPLPTKHTMECGNPRLILNLAGWSLFIPRVDGLLLMRWRQDTCDTGPTRLILRAAQQGPVTSYLPFMPALRPRGEGIVGLRGQWGRPWVPRVTHWTQLYPPNLWAFFTQRCKKPDLWGKVSSLGQGPTQYPSTTGGPDKAKASDKPSSNPLSHLSDLQQILHCSGSQSP